METEHEREREREHGKEERNPISHCIGMRKEGKSWANLLEELDPPELLSIPLILNLSSSFQAPGQTRKRRRLPFLSLPSLPPAYQQSADETVNTWAAFSGRDRMQLHTLAGPLSRPSSPY